MNFNIMEDMFILLLFLLHVFATININYCFMSYNRCITPAVTGINYNKRSTRYSTVVLSTYFD